MTTTLRTLYKIAELNRYVRFMTSDELAYLASGRTDFSDHQIARWQQAEHELLRALASSLDGVLQPSHTERHDNR